MPLPTSNNYKNSLKPPRSYGLWFSLIIFLALISLGLLNRQNISDWLSLRGYNEPASIAELSSEDTMTAYAQKVFKVNHPVIANKSLFNTECPNNGGEKTIVLGCYHSDQAGIYLLSVTDPLLNGVEQVTAAHEMLHAAYDRLSSSQKSSVDAMLENYFKYNLKDPRIISTIEAYKRTEPNDVVNEMHSVFGTEVVNLPAPLEQYYKRYFTNRLQIATFASNYQAEFTSRQSVVSQDQAKLSSMKSQIDSLKADLSTKYNAITAEQKQLNEEQNSGNIGAYNSGVNGYNQQINDYNQEVAQIKNLINSYNALVSQTNSEELVVNQLYQELSGSSQPTIHK